MRPADKRIGSRKMAIKVLIVDDSSVVRNLLSSILSADPGIDVVGTAPDPFVARDKILKYNPDVITLDVEMPRMDGITFLRKLMKHYPIPVVIVSSLTQRGTETTMDALESGAIEVIAKPEMDMTRGLEMISRDIVEKLKGAAKANVRRLVKQKPSRQRRFKSSALVESTHKVIAIGASTGGTEAIKEVLMNMPADSPGMVVVQHMPEKFTRAFAERLDTLCAVDVREAKNNDAVVPGRVLIAPGSHHMVFKRSGARYSVNLNQDAPVFHQRPSVDVLFSSVAEHAGTNSVGVILTGMGGDGAKGLLKMKEAGAKTVAQDEETSVVFGMPKEAIKLEAVDKVVALNQVAGTLLSLL